MSEPLSGACELEPGSDEEREYRGAWMSLMFGWTLGYNRDPGRYEEWLNAQGCRFQETRMPAEREPLSSGAKGFEAPHPPGSGTRRPKGTGAGRRERGKLEGSGRAPDRIEIPHIYQLRGFGGPLRTWRALPSEMTAWNAKSWWYRLTHRKEAPWAK